jgi:hypothetical protein
MIYRGNLLKNQRRHLRVIRSCDLERLQLDEEPRWKAWAFWAVVAAAVVAWTWICLVWRP